MTATTTSARVLVCGAVYGSSYLRALGEGTAGIRVAGVLGRGGAASRGHAALLGVPYYTAAGQVPAGVVDAVCVAVGGEAGIVLAEAFLERGLPVLQEHPIGADAVARLHRSAALAGACWHLNAHFADLPTVQPFIVGCRRLAAASAPLFLSATTNPRTLFSLIDILVRALPDVGPQAWRTLPVADPERDFLVTVTGPLGGAAATLHCQRTVSARDDGSATLVCHHLEAGFADGVIELADTYGPVLWRPNPGRDLSPRRAAGTEPAMWELFPARPAPLPSVIHRQRDAANLAAVAGLLQHARGYPCPAHQTTTHQLTVARTWDSLVAAFGPPLCIDPMTGS